MALTLAEASLRQVPADPSTLNGVSNVSRFGHWKAGDLQAFHATPWVPFSDEQEKRNVFVRVYRLCLRGLVEDRAASRSGRGTTFSAALRIAEQLVGRNAAAARCPPA